MNRPLAILVLFLVVVIPEVSYSQVNGIEPELKEIMQELNDCREELGYVIGTLEQIAKSDKESSQDFIIPYMHIVDVYTICLYETALLRVLEDVTEASRAFHYKKHIGVLNYAKGRIKRDYDRIKYTSPAHYLARDAVDKAKKPIGAAEQLIGESIQALESMKKNTEKSRKQIK